MIETRDAGVGTRESERGDWGRGTRDAERGT